LLAGERNSDISSYTKRTVSIHARHCWRANALASAIASEQTKFQSTPAIAGGRTAAAIDVAGVVTVSIHARHCWRANGHAAHAQAKGLFRFNPRPPLLAGER